MAEESRFVFCKQCGALARDGICQSCGYVDPDIVKPQESVQQPVYTEQQPVAQQPTYTAQEPVVQQPTYTAQQPVAAEYPYYNYSAVPTAEPEKKKKNGALVAILVSIVLLALAALIVLVIYAYGKYGDKSDRGDKDFEGDSKKIAGYDEEYDDWEDDYEDDYDWEEDYDLPEESDTADTDFENQNYVHGSYDVTEDNWNEEGQDPETAYYSGPYNALRDDLSYEISFTEEYYYSEETSNAVISIEYPQIVSGLDNCRDYINAGCYYEYEYFVDFYTEEFAPLITSKEDTFLCMVDSYVTYMDEEILSLVFVENVQMTMDGEYFSGISMYCLNFDLTTGALLTNTEVLRLDEDFAIKFRELEVYENGEGHLTAYTDQEILEMLKDEGDLVLFYTPMGMEVGLNLDEVVTYVMLEDYELYLNDF